MIGLVICAVIALVFIQSLFLFGKKSELGRMYIKLDNATRFADEQKTLAQDWARKYKWQVEKYEELKWDDNKIIGDLGKQINQTKEALSTALDERNSFRDKLIVERTKNGR